MSRGREPEISFTAGVRARTIRWHARPRVEVSFSGSSGFDSVDATRRRALPKPVRTHHTYPDVRVDYRLECALPDDVDAERPHE